MDVIIGVVIIAMVAGTVAGALSSLMRQSTSVYNITRATWMGNSVMEIVTGYAFSDPIEGKDIGTDEGEDEDDRTTFDDIDDFNEFSFSLDSYPGFSAAVEVVFADVEDGEIITEGIDDTTPFKKVTVAISSPGTDNIITYETIMSLAGNSPILESIRLSDTYNADGEGDFLFDERVFSSAEGEMSLIATFTQPVIKSGGADSDITMTLTNIRETVRDNDESPFIQSDEDLELQAVLVSDSDLDLEANQLEFQLSLFHPDNSDGDVQGNNHYSSPDLETFVSVASINYGNDEARLVAQDDQGNAMEGFEAVLNMPSDENNLMEDKVLIFLPPLQTPIFTDYDLFKQEVEANEPPPTFADIFNTWPRFDNNNYHLYDPDRNGCNPQGTQAQIENSCFDPPLSSKSKYWDLKDLGRENERIQMNTNNTQNMLGIINPNPLDDFSLEATLWNDDKSDNDLIAIVIAFVRDGSHNYYISAQRTRNGTDPCNWALVAGKPNAHSHNNCTYLNYKSWMPGIWGELMISQRVMSRTNQRPNWNDSYYPSFSRLKVTRKDNIITAETNGWVGVSNNVTTSRTQAMETAYLDDTYMRLDLETAIVTNKNGQVISSQNSINDDYLERFLSSDDEPCCSYGYAAFSQKGSTFYDIVGGEVMGAFGQWVYLGDQVVDPKLAENYEMLGIHDGDNGHFSLWDSFATEGPGEDEISWFNENEDKSQIWFYNEDVSPNVWQFSPTVNTVQAKLGWMRIVTSTVGEPTQDSPKKSFLILQENER